MDSNIYTKTLFDKAFINVVEWLNNNGYLSQREFANKLDILPSTLNKVLSGDRGVPKTKIPNAKWILVNEYKVRQDFLETNTGAMFTEKMEINLNAHHHVKDLIDENEKLKERNKDLEKRIKELTQLNETQAQMIKLMQKQSTKGSH